MVVIGHGQFQDNPFRRRVGPAIGYRETGQAYFPGIGAEGVIDIEKGMAVKIRIQSGAEHTALGGGGVGPSGQIQNRRVAAEFAIDFGAVIAEENESLPFHYCQAAAGPRQQIHRFLQFLPRGFGVGDFHRFGGRLGGGG